MRHIALIFTLIVLYSLPTLANPLMEVPPVVSSWDDLTAGLNTGADWEARRPVVQGQFLDLLRDQHKPTGPLHGLHDDLAGRILTAAPPSLNVRVSRTTVPHNAFIAAGTGLIPQEDSRSVAVPR